MVVKSQSTQYLNSQLIFNALLPDVKTVFEFKERTTIFLGMEMVFLVSKFIKMEACFNEQI